MNKKRIEKFRKRLEQERWTIVHSIRRIRSEEGDVEIGGNADESDIAAHARQEGLLLTLHDSETTRLKAITDALRRIETGQWGLCANCEEPISETRLDAVPWAAKCPGCQDRIENAHRK
jgi:DnaK suppressor protein